MLLRCYKEKAGGPRFALNSLPIVWTQSRSRYIAPLSDAQHRIRACFRAEVLLEHVFVYVYSKNRDQKVLAGDVFKTDHFEALDLRALPILPESISRHFLLRANHYQVIIYFKTTRFPKTPRWG